MDYINEEDKVQYGDTIYNKDYYITVVYPAMKLRARMLHKSLSYTGWVERVVEEDTSWDNSLLGFTNGWKNNL